MEKLKQLMMALRRLKLFLISSLYILIISFDGGLKKENNGPTLECILEVFLEKESELNEKYIYVTERQNWTDSTTVIAMRYSNIPPDKKSEKIAEFKNFLLVYHRSSFTNKVDNNKGIPTKIDWIEPDLTKFRSVNSNNWMNYSEYDVQVIYNFKENLIQDILKFYPIDKKLVFEKILNCN
jgi:hypothetical protein